ncbi:helix-turn-helix domain-containing protein [Halosquirtibacter laminarini]|uniref:Helix-turn-helix domain-containing protein n=1 Tax=Halosquirtibacter laminarini TaxID=3374600 RepID=A0AC61NBD0_9BACT|nr:helix-turn-helix domain-containing protein [Prolixibacteraceae bacterium]
MIIQQYFRPLSRELKHFIVNFSYYESNLKSTSDIWMGLIPNATTNIIISLEDEVSINDKNNRSETFISISCSSPIGIKDKKHFKAIMVQLNPFALYYILGIPMNNLTNCLIPLDSIISSHEINLLIEQINNTKEVKDKILVFEDFLKIKFDLGRVNNRLPHALNIINKNPSISMDLLSHELCITTRAVRKMFNHYIGMSPKFYSNIIRFNNSVMDIMNHPETNLTEIGLQNNYFDQSHFIKNFSLFSGMTPNQFLKNRSKSTDFYNFTLDNSHSFVKKS